MAGLTPTGFEVKTIDQILADMEAIELVQVSPSLNIQPPDIVGVMNGMVAQMASDLWLLGLALYSGMDPDLASDDQLTGLSEITGTERLAPAQTQAPHCTVSIAPSFVTAAPETMFAAVSGNPAAVFTNKEAVAYPGGGGNQNVTVDFQAVLAGPTQCLTGTLTVMSQPLTGWNSITNPNPSVIGFNVESDPDLRVRRRQELSSNGGGTPGAIKSAVLTQLVTPTTTSNTIGCTVLFNDTDAVDVNGLPPHSIEVIANQPTPTSGDDQALVNLIFEEKAAGINTYSGNATSKVATDSEGNTETIFYTRPTSVPIYIAITVQTTGAAAFIAAGGVAAVQAALANYANGVNGNPGEYQPGVNVVANPLKAQVFTSPNDPSVGVPGVVDVTAFAIGFAPSPVSSLTLPITVRQQAQVTASNTYIVVTVT